MTRDCYEIIKDETALREFIEWLPDHSDEECYMYALFCRPKYADSMRKSGGGNLLFRGISDKKSLFRKFQQLECPIGAYQKKDEIVPQESLALYIGVNPRSLYKASLNTLSSLVENIKKDHRTASPHKEALSCIQTSPADKVFIDFDVDDKEEGTLPMIREILDGISPEIIETRGGYHVLVRTKNIPEIKDKNNWYNRMARISDAIGDVLVPCVGAVQSSFIPKFVDNSKNPPIV